MQEPLQGFIVSQWTQSPLPSAVLLFHRCITMEGFVPVQRNKQPILVTLWGFVILDFEVSCDSVVT